MSDEAEAALSEIGVLADLVRGARAGRDEALDQLFQRLYRELHAMAHRQLRRSAAPAGLNTTVLVHEAYLRFSGAADVQAADRQHFLAYASTVMRSVVVDVLRAERAGKRGGGDRPLTLNTDVANGIPASGDEALRINDALAELGAIDAQLVHIVEMRFFAGLTDTEIAESLQLSIRTVQRHWQKARLFLYARLNDDTGAE
jgi:RNA polymerase sigma factor (TIGR02999 family)